MPLHSRNPHSGRYDFAALIKSAPELASFVLLSPRREPTIDFADPEAVRCLNRSILKAYYQVSDWEIPEGYLCPPIPGRADYIHHAADLLPKTSRRPLDVLDIGTGANLVYPLIGHHEYGWHFVASDIDEGALRSAARILKKNPAFASAIQLRRQKDPAKIFEGIFRTDEHFDLTICNPPFHASAAEARQGSLRKWKGLGKRPAQNFGGQSHELWCVGGERAFVTKMIRESLQFKNQCRWFTTLISKQAHVLPLVKTLAQVGVRQQRVIEMSQGQKTSRILAWNFVGD